MTTVVVAAIWLALGAGVSFLAGGGIRRADDAQQDTGAPVGAAGSPRTFTTVSTLDWVREADRVATEDLLALRPGVVRRVPAR